MIDKIIPRFFDSSTDERLLEEGAMTLAQNVTISENGDGTEGVLKNVNGTQEILAASGVVNELLNAEAVVVIGSVSDDQNNKIYFFTAEDQTNTSGAGRSSDAIYEYSVATDDYRVVIRDKRLTFYPDKFIKADVVNTTDSTILYFTDNYNPPRKINVTRALLDDSVYDTIDDDVFKKTIQAIKGASNRPPETSFETDTRRQVNNLTNKFFQFATQLIYKDGEESTLSPYSQLALHRPTAHAMLNEDGYGVLKLTDNVLNIKLNVDVSNTPDLSKIRLLARSGNASTFFVVDEFDPTEDVTRDVDGFSTTLFSANGDSYRFYNDHLGSLVSPTVANKMYDNVPQLAEGQAVAENRLFYSNYTEGYPNQDQSATASDVSRIEIDVLYSDETGQISNFFEGDETDVIVESGTPAINVTIDLNEGDASGAFGAATATEPNISPAGTTTTVRFRYAPNMTISGFSYSYDYEEEEEGYGSIQSASISSLGIDPSDAVGQDYFSITLQHTSATDETLSEVVDGLIEELNGKIFSKNYDVSSDTITGNPSYATVEFSFETFIKGDVASAAADDAAGFDIIPKVTGLKLWGGDVLSGQSASISPSSYTSGGPGYLTNEFVSSVSSGLTPTFKAGSTHSFGIVYYDEHNRSGYVNEIGSAYVKYPQERTASEGKGAASIKFTFPTDLEAPSWAKRWQIVYAGTDSYSSIFQYTTGSAYAYREENSTGAIDETSGRIYVSLKTLDLYQKDRPGNLRDYSFTEGDKLRVVKFWAASLNEWVYPAANDGTVIEFDVVGVKTLSSSDRDIATSPGEEHEGTFLILEHPYITSGVDTLAEGATGDQLKYAGWDFYTVANSQGATGVDYPNSDDATTVSNWGKRSVVDIVSLRDHTSEKIYYEVGVGGFTNAGVVAKVGHHQYLSLTTNAGDCYYRPVTCKSVNYASSWQFDSPDTWDDRVIYLEDSSITDSVSSKHWSRGRAHIVFQKAATNRNINSVTYSDPFNQDMSTLTLSSFDAANYANLNLGYGAARYISNYNGNLLALQENKVSVTPINKSIFNQAGGGDQVISLSSDVLNTSNTNYLTGDYGIANHPESVLIYDNQVFFADSSRSAIIRISSEGLSPISEKNISSYITSQFSTFNSGAPDYRTISSGYDPENHIYYVTLRKRNIGGFNASVGGIYENDDSSVTLGYDVRRGKWQGTYTFYPDRYAWINNSMYSFRFVNNPFDTAGETPEQERIMHKHSSSASRNRFYGESADDSIVEIVSKFNPSAIKVFDSISIEGDHAWGAQVTSPLGQDTGAGNMPAGNFVKKEGYWYSAIAGDSSSNTSKNAIHVGEASDISGNQITISGGLYRKRVPVGSTIKFIDGSSFANSNNTDDGFVTVDSVNYDTGVITASGNVLSSSANKVMVVFTDSALNGDRIRGPYAKIKLTLNETSASELYSVNVNFTNSALNHALGQ